MSLSIAVLGDRTDHGGKIVTASDTHMINGKPIARLHDLVECPEHGVNRIIEAHPTLMVGGIRVALHGHHTECGCALISSTVARVG
ncbi:PAAR domain-containing protein [Paraburkholderia sp. MPAMCS5]|uniref:PAAR domain-containing protein n=1 Tax=Paraburkholderia sp. MPAMCS5 TaxID=3112563 RepID=UPI002E16BE07|nr:PAAR domain-containing protein [Paraburkholderia sp. MPAMCS5]